MKRIWVFLPITVLLGLAVLLYVGLNEGPPSALPSPLIGKPAPNFTMPPLDAKAQGFTRADLGQGHPVIVNFWASWCVPCRIEHPVLQELAAKAGVTLYGVSYEDAPQQSRAFLDEDGNPFGKIDTDRDGRVGIDWGVTGVPETFVIDGKGVIRLHYAGPLDEDILQRLILPALGK